MDRHRKTRLFVFDGGVLEVYDYGESSEDDYGPGVYLELHGRPSALSDVAPDHDDIETEAS